MDKNTEKNNFSTMPVKKEMIPSGTTIHQEKPFVYVLSSKFRTDCCDFCFKKEAGLLKCSNCKYVYYCGKTCQRQGWIIHKQECKKLGVITPRILPDAARLLFRLIKKLQSGGVMFKSYYTDKDYRMWRDLMTHYPEVKQHARRIEHLTSLYGVLTEFSQNDLLPTFAELMVMYGRMCVNSFNICNQELQSLGTGIYLGASIIDHSCEPTALATFEGTSIFIRTLQDLPELDWSKVKISYIDILATTEERQKELLDTYYFLCDCPKCMLPENHSEMFGAACPNKSCNNSIEIDKDPCEISCDKCGTKLSQEFINNFKDVEEFTEMHLANMKNTIYLDVCKVCLSKQRGVLNKSHLRHIKTLDLAFEGSIDLGDFDSALKYGLELVDGYWKYYPKIHPLTGLLHLKLAKLYLYKNQSKEGWNHLKIAKDILKITHGPGSSLYKYEILPLIPQCTSV